MKRIPSLILLALLLASLGCERRPTEHELKVAKARQDLARIGNALSAFRTHYGDFPRVPSDSLIEREPLSSRRLWASLRGTRGSDYSDAKLAEPRQNFAAHIQDVPTKLSGKESDYDRECPVDPWGNPYRYHYRPEAGDEIFSLYSVGPDGDAIFTRPADLSALRDGKAVNADNVIVAYP